MSTMSKMTQTSEHLLYLMACALQGVSAREEILTNVDLKQLLIMARKHSVASMVCMALEKTAIFANADEAEKKQWLEAKNKAIRKNMLLDAERKAILHELETQGIWYMPLKGSILKDWYPKPGMREMADNDILFDPSGCEQVREIFQNRGYKTVSFSKGNHDEYEKAPIYNFEMHISLFHGMYKGLAEQYTNVKEHLLPVDGTAYQFAFTPEDFYVFALAHAHKHYSHSGTGVRTLADIYVMDRHLGDIMDRDEVEQKLTQLGIAEYEQHSRGLAEKLFSAVRPLAEIELTEDEKEMLLYYCDATTYGTVDNRVNNRLHELQENSESITLRTKLKYCRVRLFPGREFCKFVYPFVYKHPWTLPFFWVWRIVDRGIANKKNVQQEFKALKAVSRK
ncbi:Uncharacterised protein [uncultured Clostridium sp.]|nr:Uncharacterised protein [uncultured Clostridium sp.]